VSALRAARVELPIFGLGIGATVAAVLATGKIGETVTLALLIALLLFFGLVVGFIAAPHATIALAIPLFALLPALKVLAIPSIGPLKDLISFAAIAAAGALVVKASSTGERVQSDFWLGLLVATVGALYLVNLGGGLEWDIAWAHGVRLVCVPLLLLLVGLTLGESRRVLDWALASLVATGCFVAVVGLVQQQLGLTRLQSLGYEYDQQLRTIGERFRSFGTMDDPFIYATFLTFALAAVLFWMRRRPLAYAAGTLLVAGLAASYVRTALIIVAALIGLWLARERQTTTAVSFLAAAVVVGAIVFVSASGASETRKVRTSEGSSYLTINERTTGWKLLFADRNSLGFGKGVGEVGTAAERASYTLTRDLEGDGELAVDSGYLATVADVGLVGLSLLLLLFMRILTLARRGLRHASQGWLVIALVTIMLIDALTRASFTSYPNAFLGFLLIGLALGIPAAGATRSREVIT
jgi:hypothetical protein